MTTVNNSFIFVVEKVIILVCDNLSLPQKDEQIVSRTIEEILIQRRKGHFAWLKNGRLSVDPDVFVQCLMSTSPTPQPNPQINPLRASQDKTEIPQVQQRNRFPPVQVNHKVILFKGILQTGNKDIGAMHQICSSQRIELSHAILLL